MQILQNSINFRAKLDISGVKKTPAWKKAAKIFEEQTKNLDDRFDITVEENINKLPKYPFHEIVFWAEPFKDSAYNRSITPIPRFQLADMGEWAGHQPKGVSEFYKLDYRQMAEKMVKLANFIKQLAEEFESKFPEIKDKSANLWKNSEERGDWYRQKVNEFFQSDSIWKNAISGTEAGGVAEWAEFLK